MGIREAISGTTDSLKRNAPDLTAVKSWCPTTDSLKRIAPDGTAAKNVFSAAYGYGSSAVTKVDGAVTGNLIPYVKNEVAWSKIAQLGTIVAKHATHEAFKLVPGGSAFYNVGARSIHDFNNSKKQEPDVKAMQAKVLRLEKELSKYKELSRKQVYELVQEQIKDQTPSTCLDDKKKQQDFKLGMEKNQEMQVKMKKTQEESITVKQPHQISAKPVKRSDYPMPDESIHGSDIPENNRKKIFVRSRL